MKGGEIFGYNVARRLLVCKQTGKGSGYKQRLVVLYPAKLTEKARRVQYRAGAVPNSGLSEAPQVADEAGSSFRKEGVVAHGAGRRHQKDENGFVKNKSIAAGVRRSNFTWCFEPRG